jgi:hypothetical protein
MRLVGIVRSAGCVGNSRTPTGPPVLANAGLGHRVFHVVPFQCRITIL